MKKILANFEEIAACAFLVVLIILVSVNVVYRLCTTKSFNWMEEIVYLSFAYVIFLGASAAFKRNMHSGIDIFVRILPKYLQAVVAALTTFALLVICCTVCWLSFKYAAGSGLKKTPILRIPYFYIDISVTLGFFMMCIHCLKFIFNIFCYKDYFKRRMLYSDIYIYTSADDESLEEIKGGNQL